MKSTNYIRSGIRITSNGEDNSPGSLGLLANHKETNEVIGLCASQTINSGSSVIASYENGMQETIGNIDQKAVPHHIYANPPTLDHLVSRFSIKSELPASPNTLGGVAPTSILKPDECLGEIVCKGVVGANATYGRVMSVRSQVHVRSAVTGVVTAYAGAIEVLSTADNAPFAERGDSGALVVTERNEIIGLIIAGNERKSYVAPLHNYMKTECLSPIQNYSELAVAEIVGSSESMTSLLSQCQQNPESWQNIVKRERMHLHYEFQAVMTHSAGDREDKRHTMEQVQDYLAKKLLGLVGAENLLAGILDLSYFRHGVDSDANDNWLLRSLVERVGLVKVKTTENDIVFLVGSKKMVFSRKDFQRNLVGAPSIPTSASKKSYDDFSNNQELANLAFGQTYLPLSDHV